MLFRVFPWDPRAGLHDEGGALHVARSLQGRGRYDVPARFGALYASRRATSAVAEYLVKFRPRPVPPDVFVSANGVRRAIAAIDDSRLDPLLDLDDAREMATRMLRPSEVATGDREITQPIAERLFGEGHQGFQWWSTIEASWMNVTLFAERVAGKLRLVEPPLPLERDVTEVAEAARALQIDL